MGEGLLGLVGPPVHDVRGDPCLDVDQGDVVGDDVVQVPCDAQPLLGDPAPGLLLAGAFGAFGALLYGVHEAAMAADGVPGRRAMPVQANRPRFSWVYQGSGPLSIAVPVSTVIVSTPTRQVVGRSVATATVNSAMTAAIETGARGSPVISSTRARAVVTPSTGSGASRRSTRRRRPGASGRG